MITKTERHARDLLANPNIVNNPTSNDQNNQGPAFHASPKKATTFKVKSAVHQQVKQKPGVHWNQPQEVPPTKIKIWHEFDNALHFHHKFNATVRNINIVVRLIFKNTKDQSAITAVSLGTSSLQTQSLIDENRLKEIQKIASTMKVNIPKRFESRTAIREFIQSREFIAAMKQSMNSQLFLCINNCNNILGLINAKQAKHAKMHDKSHFRQREREQRELMTAGVGGQQSHREAGNANGALGANGGGSSPQKKNQGSLHGGGKSDRKRSIVTSGQQTTGSSTAASMSVNQQASEGKHGHGSGSNATNKRQMGEDQTLARTGSNFNQTLNNGFGDKDKKSSKKKEKQKEREQLSLRLQKMKEEEEEFERELEEHLEEEAIRREEEELDPLTKEDRQRIKEKLIKEREKLNEKEKLLQITQKYFIGPGNNYQVVKNVIKQRYWWTQAPTEDFQDANFVWTSWKRDKHIEYLKQKGQNELDQPIKIYSRMNNNKQLTNKKGIFINMREYYKIIGVDPFSILPLTFLIKNSSDSEFRKFQREHNRIIYLQKENKHKQQELITEHLAKKKKEMMAKGQRP